ncbi:MAG: response regulator transcription factor [Dehalococcoidia bacterium]
MARLTGKDYREVLNLIYLANRCEDVEGFINALFPFMMQTFHVECATFQLVKGYPRHIHIGESRSFKSDSQNLHEDKYYCPQYKDSFYQHSPLLKEALVSSKVALKIGDSISVQEWERSVLYNEFIRPQYLYWELFLALRWQRNLEGMITLWRPKGQPDYADRDVLKAEMLASHLGVAIHNIRLISQNNTRESPSLPSDEANGEGVLWLDHGFNPYFYNAKAKDICLRLSGRAVADASVSEKAEFPIPACIIQDCSELMELLKAKGQPILPPKERIILAEGGQKFRTECSLVWKVGRLSSQPNFVISLFDFTDERRLETTFQNRFQLSRRELDVIHYLTKGMSDDEIGEKLYISRQTVHTHIKNIYRKLGVKSRVELYRTVIRARYPGVFNHKIG